MAPPLDEVTELLHTTHFSSRTDQESLTLKQNGQPVAIAHPKNPYCRVLKPNTSRGGPRESATNELDKFIRDNIARAMGLKALPDQGIHDPRFQPPSPNDIQAFLNGSLVPGPNLERMRFEWVRPKDSVWNMEASALLARDIRRQLATNPPKHGFAKGYQEDMWLENRILDKLHYIHMKHKSVCDIQIAEEKAKTARESNRQSDLYHNRIGICTARGLTSMKAIVEVLGTGGMSSDESEEDGNGKVTYTIKRRPWRNPIITTLLHHIVDARRNPLNLRGRRPPCNTFRERIWPPKKDSANEPIRGLPLNYYDPTWLKSAPTRIIRQLKAGPAVPFEE